MFKKLCIFILCICTITGCSKEQPSLVVKEGDKEIICTDIVSTLNSVTFPAVVRSSGSKPVETEYKGIELTELFNSIDITISNYEKVVFNAYDGYRIILTTEEISEPSNVYLVFERDGEILKSKKEGGTGPFQIVIRRDPFSQRWIKHVFEIILE